MNKQTFFIVDAKTVKLLKKEIRSNVHRNGAWHQAVNAYIVRPDSNGSFDLLVQKRSVYVDIAQNKIDQSVATQLLVKDKGNLENAIIRGLTEELGILINDIHTIKQFNHDNSIKISKKYIYNIDLWNRELITSFIVILKPKIEFKLCPKVESVEWLNWEEFKNIILINPNSATKTVRLFAVNNQANIIFEEFVQSLLKNRSIETIPLSYYFISELTEDMSVVSNNSTTEIIKYTTDPTISPIQSVNLKSHFTIDQLINNYETISEIDKFIQGSYENIFHYNSKI